MRSRALYAPADGRLAAAMATISARRRPIRDGAERNSERKCRMSRLPSAPAETIVSRSKAHDAKMVPPRTRVESAAKSVVRPTLVQQWIYCRHPAAGGRNLLSRKSARRNRRRHPPCSIMPMTAVIRPPFDQIAVTKYKYDSDL
jgi:hypothetical protein